MRRRMVMAKKLHRNSGIDVNNYFTVEALEDGLTIKFGSACEYCIDGNGEWVSLSKNTVSPTINTGQIISLRANNLTMSYSGVGRCYITKKCNILGNIMSLRYGDDAAETTELDVQYAFLNLLREQPIVSISKNFLPATTIASDCYSSLFNGCSSLVSAPDLPALVLPPSCYRSMFNGCSNLKYIKMMATTLGTNSLSGWVTGVAAAGTFVKNKNAKWNDTGTSGVPSGWTVITE